MARRLIYALTPSDNVATALVELEPGMEVAVDPGEAAPDSTARRVTIRSAIPFGHKVAIAPIAPGEPVVKYGEVIGRATRPIAPGDHVHVHNLESQRGRGDLAAAPPRPPG